MRALSTQLVRHRQVRRVIGVELNDVATPFLGRHPPLQRQQNGVQLALARGRA
jgi:hypothetical protein